MSKELTVMREGWVVGRGKGTTWIRKECAMEKEAKVEEVDF